MWEDVLNSNDVNRYFKIFLGKKLQCIYSSTSIELESSKNKNIKEWMTATS